MSAAYRIPLLSASRFSYQLLAWTTVVASTVKKINADRAIELVTRLMAIPGKSCQEAQIAHQVEEELRNGLGIDSASIAYDTAHKRAPTDGEIGNLVVRLPGKRGLPRLLLSAHLDTVPVCVGAQPKRVGQKIKSADPNTGLGADDRAGVASVLTAVREAREEIGTDVPPLTMCFFVQEEIGLHGSRHMSKSMLGKPAMAINFDGGNPLKMTIGATGGERMKIKMHGLAAHAGLDPAAGASAITATGLAIAALQKNRWLGAVKKKGQVGTSNIGVVHGGVATNVVADYAEIDAEARSHDGDFRLAIADAIEKAFVEAAAATRSKDGQAVRAEVIRRVDYESFRLDERSPVVSLVTSSMSALGHEPTCVVTNGGVDANWMVKHGLPTVSIGCGQRDVHTTKESLHIPDFLTACSIGKSVIMSVGR